MTHLWHVGKSLVGWCMGQQQGEDSGSCDWLDDEDNDVQTSSGIGTVIVIYAALAGLFLGANFLPSQLGQATQSARTQPLRKEQQRVRDRRQTPTPTLNLAERRRSPKRPSDNWQDALQPSDEEEAQFLAMRRDLYYDVAIDNSEEDRFLEARED